MSCSPASLIKMFSNASPTQEHVDYNKDTTIQQPEQMACTISVSIPKVEPCCYSESDFSEGTSDTNGIITSPIPFTTPYKVKDPIVLLEKCDKIWETLKLIKDVQGSNSLGTFNELSSNITNSESLYIKYQPVLGNNNTALPNFKFSIKTTQKLFHCSTCGKLYTTNRSLRSHSDRIHGIYIPPKRTSQSKKHETRLVTDSLPQSVPSNETECKSPSASNVQLQKKKKNVFIPASNNIDGNENIKKDEKGTMHKELKQNEKSTVLQNDLVSQQCVLCKQLVKNIREHLTDYHKIECSNLMLQELEKTSAAPKVKELNKISVNNEPLKNNGIIQDKHFVSCQRKRKEKSNISHENLKKKPKLDSDGNNFKTQGEMEKSIRQCDICYGIYKAKSFSKHLRIHRIRGETKNNFHLFSCNYLNSPFCSRHKGTENSNNVSPENTNLFKAKMQKQMCNNQSSYMTRSYMKNHFKELETTCSCGRSFRNPHTLYMHKTKCHFPNSKETQLAKNSKLDMSAMQNRCDKDSGVGISITIKKKNNSYEVVGKDIGDENKLQSSSDSRNINEVSDMSEDDTEVDSQDQQYIVESSKYSENHSILRIQFVDEDVDVDIEEDSQNNLFNNNICDKLITNEMINDFKKDDQMQEKKVEQNNSNSNFSCKNVVAEEEHENCNDTMLKINSNNNICLCGNIYDSKEALDIHINEHHKSAQLMCGYCKENFHNIIGWHKHKCSITKGGVYVDPLFEISCHYCSAVFNCYVKFDQHIKLKHYDSVVPYQCYKCQKRFSSAACRKLHFETDHNLPTCTICGKYCTDTMKFRHEAYHYGLGFPCHTCKKTYNSKFILSRHISKVHKKKHTEGIFTKRNIEPES
ncbi:zinc finger protein 62-like isoform X1 [Colletes gigas]|uniref:zinc finger protein 62-like isoform X1 n=2 Tax=Colletes gigas TaxID=935657 RepID=UPI001C9B2DF6|nr:zinc finger protein 62-like isoform X1 [Colletes gigas]